MASKTLAPHDGRVDTLEEIKSEIVTLCQAGDAIIFLITDLVARIKSESLYEVAGYRSMNAYYPALIAELKERGLVSRMGKRHLQEMMRIDSLFCRQLGVPREEVMALGASHFIELAERLDYDRRTGEIPDREPPPGKLSKGQVLDLVEDIKTGGWRVEDTVQAADEARGIEQRRIELRWRANQGEAQLTRFYVWEGDTLYDVYSGMPRHLAEWLVKRMQASGNLDV